MAFIVDVGRSRCRCRIVSFNSTISFDGGGGDLVVRCHPCQSCCRMPPFLSPVAELSHCRRRRHCRDRHVRASKVPSRSAAVIGPTKIGAHPEISCSCVYIMVIHRTICIASSFPASFRMLLSCFVGAAATNAPAPLIVGAIIVPRPVTSAAKFCARAHLFSRLEEPSWFSIVVVVD